MENTRRHERERRTVCTARALQWDFSLSCKVGTRVDSRFLFPFYSPFDSLECNGTIVVRRRVWPLAKVATAKKDILV
jgi:hypothetical protein